MKFTSPFLSLGFAIFLTLLKFSFSSEIWDGCPGFESVPQIGKTAPRLKISKFPTGAVQENGRDVVIKPNIFSFDLDCWASYPIDLEFSGQLTNQWAKVNTKVTGFTKSDGISAHCYRITASLTSYKEITGNYSCFSVDNRALISSRYIFAQNPPSTILLRSNEFVTVRVKPGQKSVILPCAISNPTFSKDIQLIRVNGSDSHWILESASLKYDAKIGFIMTLPPPPLMETAFGSYECRAGSGHDVVKIKLIGPPDFTVFPITKRILSLKLGDRLIIECLSKSGDVLLKTYPELEHDQAMMADVNKNKTFFHNRDLLSFYKSAEILVTKPFTGNNSQHNDHHQPEIGRVECVRKSNNEMLYQWQYRVSSNESRKAGILDTSSFLNSCPPSNSSGNGLDIVLFECDNWGGCKMSQCLRNDSTCRSNNHCVKKLCMPNGIIQCPFETGAHAEIFFTGFNDVKYTNWKAAETKDLLRILPTVVQNSSDFAALMCEGTRFVFAGGFKWSLQFKNGTVIDVQRFINDTVPKEMWGDNRSILRNILPLSMAWKPFLQSSTTIIDTIICSGAVWNSTEWINQTMKIEDITRFRKNANSGVTLFEPQSWLYLFALKCITMLRLFN